MSLGCGRRVLEASLGQVVRWHEAPHLLPFTAGLELLPPGVWEHPVVSDRRPGKAGVCPGIVPRLGSPPSPAGRRLPLASSLPSQPVPSPPQARGHGDLPKRLLVALGYWFQWSLPLKNLGNGYSLSLLFLETAKQHERTVSL